MTCPSQPELVLFMDGALAPARLAEVRRHVDGCAACRAELSRLEAGVRALREGSPAPEPSPYFASRLAARLASEPPRRRGLARLFPKVRFPVRPLALGAGAVAVLIAAALISLPRLRKAEELSLADELALSEDYEVVASVGDVESAEDVAVIASLGEEGGRP